MYAKRFSTTGTCTADGKQQQQEDDYIATTIATPTATVEQQRNIAVVTPN